MKENHPGYATIIIAILAVTFAATNTYLTLNKYKEGRITGNTIENYEEEKTLQATMKVSREEATLPETEGELSFGIIKPGDWGRAKIQISNTGGKKIIEITGEGEIKDYLTPQHTIINERENKELTLTVKTTKETKEEQYSGKIIINIQRME